MRRGKWIAIGGTCALLLTYLIIQVLGYVILVDHSGQVVSATIIGSDGATQQPMYRLPGGRFVAIPSIEGDVEIRCRDGSVGRGGYVTPHMPERLEVRSGKTCDTAFVG